MIRRWAFALASIVVSSMAFGTALAASQPSAKATAQAADINVLSTEDANSYGEWTTILSNGIKTPNQQDLFIDVSMECGLSTRTLVKSKGGKSDTSSAVASVLVRVMIDGVEADPGAVTFCNRSQELTATFQGLIDGCLSLNELGNIVLDEACLEPEELELVLSTMAANSYNFIAGDLSSGVHQIDVQTRIYVGSSAEAGSAEAQARIGKGSVTVEQVRMVKGEDYELY